MTQGDDSGGTASQAGLGAAWPVTALIYARNNESSVGAAVEDLARALEPRARAYEILVLDDASDDDTAARAEAAAGEIGGQHRTVGLVPHPQPRNAVPRFRVVRRDGPPAFGAALRLGLAEAHHPLILQVDARNRVDLSAIDAMLAELDLCHVVVGRRRRGARGPCRPFAAAILWFLRRVVYGIPVSDVDCPMRLYRREAFERLRIQSDGAFAGAEILAKAGFFGLMIGEVDVAIRPDAAAWEPREKVALVPVLREAWHLFRHPVLLPPAGAAEEGAGPPGARAADPFAHADPSSSETDRQ